MSYTNHIINDSLMKSGQILGISNKQNNIYGAIKDKCSWHLKRYCR